MNSDLLVSNYHLCIDQGNSSTKVGVFDGHNLIFAKIFNDLTIIELKSVLLNYSCKACILSSVITLNESLIDFLTNKFEKFIELNQSTNIPIKNKYKTPETLGKDRLAAVVGASYLQPNRNILVIDAGTAITYDFIDAQKNYLGGNIAPGIDLRLKALHHFTQKLPLVNAEVETPLLGNNTQSAILSGAIYGVVFEIDGYIDTFQNKYSNLSTFLTGGSTFYIDTKVKNAIFAEKNLVLIGLNRILQYNV